MKIADYKPEESFYGRTIESLTEEQDRSYRHIIKQINNGIYVDIKNNDYLDVYLNELNTQLRQSLTTRNTDSLHDLAKSFGSIVEHYQDTHIDTVHQCYPSLIFALHASGKSIESVIQNWLDFMLKMGRYAAFDGILTSMYTTFFDVNASDYIDAKYLSVFAMTNIRRHLTEFGNNHFDDILAIISDLLNRDYQLSNTNFIYRMYKFEDGEISVVDNAGSVGADHLFNLQITTLSRKTEYDEGIYSIKSQVPVYTPPVRDAYIKTLTREAEAILRDETGVDHRWVSESVLFKQIQSAFIDQRVQQHASPSFLGRQHYDVYMPELGIALEYQGDQHFRPIDFFGGEAGFIETQKRDKRKRSLSEENGIFQIDVLPGYDIAEVLEKILQQDGLDEYDLEALIFGARTLNRDEANSSESRESVVARINLDHKVNTNDDEKLVVIIDRLIEEASKTKIGQRKLNTDAILRYQGLSSKYRRTEEYEKELQVLIMMAARGLKGHSFDEHYREKELIIKIGIDKFTEA